MRHYLPQSIGFFIQFFPAVILLFVPFTQNSMRFNRKYIFAYATAGSVLAASLFSLLLSILNVHIDIYTNLFFLLSSLITGIIFNYVIQDSFIKKTVALSVSVFYVATLFMVRCLLRPWFPSIVSGGFQSLDLLVMTIAAIILAYICYSVDRLFLKKYFKRFLPEEMHKETIITFIEMVVYLILIIFYMVIFRGRNEYWTQVAPLFITITILLYLTYYLLFSEVLMKSEAEELQRIQDIRMMQYQKIESEIETARREIHDRRHHISNLYNLTMTEDMDKVRNYLNELSIKSNFINTEQYCFNEAVNNCLQYYIDWAKNLNIECHISVDVPRYFIDGDDLTLLFGNILENAIFASELVQGNKWIRIKAETVGSSFAILIDNSCSRINTSSVYRINQTWQPADAFKSIRGKKAYGLKAVEDIALKYNGSAQFSFDEEKQTFTSRILLKDVI